MAELASMAPTTGGQYRTCADCLTKEPHLADRTQIGCLSLRREGEVLGAVQERARADKIIF
jgi:hypothetical protein